MADIDGLLSGVDFGANTHPDPSRIDRRRARPVTSTFQELLAFELGVAIGDWRIRKSYVVRIERTITRNERDELPCGPPAPPHLSAKAILPPV